MLLLFFLFRRRLGGGLFRVGGLFGVCGRLFGVGGLRSGGLLGGFLGPLGRLVSLSRLGVYSGNGILLLLPLLSRGSILLLLRICNGSLLFG